MIFRVIPVMGVNAMGTEGYLKNSPVFMVMFTVTFVLLYVVNIRRNGGL